MNVRPRNVLALVGYFLLVAGPFASCVLIPRAYGLLFGESALSVPAAIAGATATAEAPLDPITCFGRMMGPNERCIVSQGGRNGTVYYTYQTRQQAEQARKDRAEERALDDLSNARNPVRTRILGVVLFGAALSAWIATIVWYQRARKRAKLGTLHYSTFGELLGRDSARGTL
jgi:hypothetical protein